LRIIDGYNVIGAGADLGLALDQPDKEERLLRLLARWRSRRRGREAMLVVFDGHHGRLAVGPRTFSRAGIDVEYAIGESADAVIVRRVRSAARPREIEVVTSDRLVLRAIEGWGARGTRSPEFLATLGRALDEQPAAEKPQESSAEEVAAWLERFGGPAGDS
jgi:predicted RNA-binding protein with PIN domain